MSTNNDEITEKLKTIIKENEEQIITKNNSEDNNSSSVNETEEVVEDFTNNPPIITDYYIEDINTKLAFYINKTALFDQVHDSNHVENNRNMLQRSINQFANMNPDFYIILLTDEHDFTYENCIQYNIEEFNYIIEEFDTIYKPNHRSTNPYTYERFCFARWIIIKEFLNKYFPNIKNVMIMDNDTLIFKNMYNFMNELTNVDLYISICGCPAFTIIGKNALYAICDYMNYSFTKCNPILDKIYAKFGVVSDMTFLNYYCSENIMNSLLYHQDYSINIIYNDIHKTTYKLGFYFSNAAVHDLIKYEIKDENLYLLNLQDNYLKEITNYTVCAGIHFAGGSKYLFEKYYNDLYYKTGENLKNKEINNEN